MKSKRACKPTFDPREYTFDLPNGSLFPDQLVKGTEVSLTGRRGARFRFQYACQTSTGRTVLTFVGGPTSGQNDEFVSVYPEKISKVHRNVKTARNIQQEKKRDLIRHPR